MNHDNRAIKKKGTTGKTALPFWPHIRLGQCTGVPRFISTGLLGASLRKILKFHALTIGCFAFLLFMQHETDSRARPVCVIHPTI